MPLITQSELNEISFPDAEVIEFHLDFVRECFKLKCSEAYIGQTPNGRALLNVVVKIDGFSQMSIREFNDGVFSAVESYADADLALKDICEFLVSKNIVALRGFSRLRGHWTEYTFEGGNLEISYESYPEM
jgi:hypothetical protein